MKKIILTRGIPASGKSTWSKKQESATIYNKDSIRKEMGITSENWTKQLEEDVVKIEREGVENSLSRGDKLVIVDNTHLGDYNKHILFYQELAEKYGYEFIIKDFFCSKEEAIRRDNNRPEEERVGSKIIGKMCKIQGNGGMPRHPEFLERFDTSYEDGVIFDIDGTLAFMKGKRTPYEYDKVNLDEPNNHLIYLLNLLKEKNKIIVVSGRNDSCQEMTENWLKDNGIHYDEIYMRKDGDTREDSIVKKEIYDTYIAPYRNINAVFDDRNRVVDMWRIQCKLPTYDVWYGSF